MSTFDALGNKHTAAGTPGGGRFETQQKGEVPCALLGTDDHPLNLLHPAQVSPRLLPGVQVGDAWVSVEFDDYTPDDRLAWNWYIDTPDGSWSGGDLHSGVGEEPNEYGVDGALGAMMSFLGAAADGERHGGNPDGDGRLFPVEVCQWAYQSSDEIGLVACEFEERDLG